MKVSIITLGCRVNQAESDEMGALLKARGVDIVDIKDNPEYCIINTCTVTAESDQNSRQFIRRAGRSGAKVIVTGCYAQLRRAEAASLEGVVGVYDNVSKDQIIGFITPDGPLQHARWSERSRPYIKVQDGCDFRCSYCAVPLARGRSRSLPVGDVVKRAVELETSGFREIVLTGIHLGIYGRDLDSRPVLAGLLRRVLDSTSTCRIRLSSIEVSEIDGSLLDLLDEDRVCNHLHIPLQSGSNRILQLMHRNYGKELYRETLEKVIRRNPGIAIGTDLMVGFPGENENDFTDSLNFIKSIPFSYLHVFPYSRRPHTPAASMSGQVPRSVVRERMAVVRQIDSEKRMAYMSRQLGRRLKVIMEERHRSNWVVGTSGNFLKIWLSSDKMERGRLVPVRAMGIRDGHIEAELIVDHIDITH